MKATGSKLHLIQETIDHNTGMHGEVYYDSDRNLYAVFINGSFASEHVNEDDALLSMTEELDYYEG